MKTCFVNHLSRRTKTPTNFSVSIHIATFVIFMVFFLNISPGFFLTQEMKLQHRVFFAHLLLALAADDDEEIAYWYFGSYPYGYSTNPP